MTPVELVLSKLPDARQNGTGWQARCPAHERDGGKHRPSLSVAEGDDGRALVTCHAGCTVEEVCGAIGLRVADLMPPRQAGTAHKSTNKRPAITYPTAAAAVAELERQHCKRAALWTYCNARAEPVGVVVRWNKAEGKDVRPASRNGHGWFIGGMPEPRPLYGLPELQARAGERVCVTEGEPAADAAHSAGLLTTTSPHGSNSADKADWRPLAGRDAVILPDNDPAGAKYANTVARILAGLQPPATVRVVRLPDLPAGGDFVEYLQARRAAGLGDEAIRAEVEALADAAEPIKPEAPEVAAPPLSFRPFPLGALPDPVRVFVRAVAQATGTDHAFAALAAMVVLAGCLGNRVAALVKSGWVDGR